MKLLLETHAFLWFIDDDPRLSLTAKTTIETTPEVYVSLVSVWEMAVKISNGKLTVPESLREFVMQHLTRNRFQLLPIELEHTVMVAQLPLHHKDPFDRLLICQAMSTGFRLVSADSMFAEYAVAPVW